MIKCYEWVYHCSPEDGFRNTPSTSLHLRPDVVVWSSKARVVHLIELIVPLEEGIETAFKRNQAKYTLLASECWEAGWTTTI